MLAGERPVTQGLQCGKHMCDRLVTVRMENSNTGQYPHTAVGLFSVTGGEVGRMKKCH